ncbi:MAG: hypothetical protein GXO14_06845 [Thermococci archaeon]|nr:hypothetical protein [Thermococci archaeon]
MDRWKLLVIVVLSVAAILSPNFWMRWILVILLGVLLVLMLFWNVELPDSRPEEIEVPAGLDEIERVTKMISNSKRHKTSRRLLMKYLAEAYAMMSGDDPNLEYRRVMENPNRALKLVSESGGSSEFLKNLRKALDVLEEDINWKN